MSTKRRQPIDLGGEYGFQIGPKDPRPGWRGQTTWHAHLPHQCDEWEIAAETSHDTAVLRMEAFVAEAQAALERLRLMGTEDRP